MHNRHTSNRTPEQYRHYGSFTPESTSSERLPEFRHVIIGPPEAWPFGDESDESDPEARYLTRCILQHVATDRADPDARPDGGTTGPTCPECASPNVTRTTDGRACTDCGATWAFSWRSALFDDDPDVRPDGGDTPEERPTLVHTVHSPPADWFQRRTDDESDPDLRTDGGQPAPVTQTPETVTIANGNGREAVTVTIEPENASGARAIAARVVDVLAAEWAARQVTIGPETDPEQLASFDALRYGDRIEYVGPEAFPGEWAAPKPHEQPYTFKHRSAGGTLACSTVHNAPKRLGPDHPANDPAYWRVVNADREPELVTDGGRRREDQDLDADLRALYDALEAMAAEQGCPTYFTVADLRERAQTDLHAQAVYTVLDRGRAPAGYRVSVWNYGSSNTTLWMLEEREDAPDGEPDRELVTDGGTDRTAVAWWIEHDDDRQYLCYDTDRGKTISVDITDASFGGEVVPTDDGLRTDGGHPEGAEQDGPDPQPGQILTDIGQETRPPVVVLANLAETAGEVELDHDGETVTLDQYPGNEGVNPSERVVRAAYTSSLDERVRDELDGDGDVGYVLRSIVADRDVATYALPVSRLGPVEDDGDSEEPEERTDGRGYSTKYPSPGVAERAAFVPEEPDLVRKVAGEGGDRA